MKEVSLRSLKSYIDLFIIVTDFSESIWLANELCLLSNVGGQFIFFTFLTNIIFKTKKVGIYVLYTL